MWLLGLFLGSSTREQGEFILCDEQVQLQTQTDPLFKDAERQPPLNRPATLDYLVEHGWPLAEWIEEAARDCDLNLRMH